MLWGFWSVWTGTPTGARLWCRGGAFAEAGSPGGRTPHAPLLGRLTPHASLRP